MLVHTGQDTSSRRLWSNVLISMLSSEASEQSSDFGEFETIKPCAIFEINLCYDNRS